MIKHPTHRPIHLRFDQAIYFLTAHTYFYYPHLIKLNVRRFFLRKLEEIAKLYWATLYGWVVLDTHYHLLVKFSQNSLVSNFIKHLHGATAHFINQQKYEANFLREFFRGLTPFEERQWRRLKSASSTLKPANFSSRPNDELAQFIAHLKPPPVWYQYTDHLIRNEHDFYRHLNYIHQNPVKHGLAKRLEDYPFSSYQKYLRVKGRAWLTDCFEKYPIIDFQPVGGV